MLGISTTAKIICGSLNMLSLCAAVMG
jgi:hypothetical protein